MANYIMAKLCNFLLFFLTLNSALRAISVECYQWYLASGLHMLEHYDILINSLSKPF